MLLDLTRRQPSLMPFAYGCNHGLPRPFPFLPCDSRRQQGLAPGAEVSIGSVPERSIAPPNRLDRDTVLMPAQNLLDDSFSTPAPADRSLRNLEPRLQESIPSTAKVELTMLTVSVSPKLMFMEGSRFRPWIIPAGLDFHVISPPSNDTTVLDVGVQFAAGAQYRVWKAVHLGVDGRFHLAAGETDTTNNFGTVGAYLGIGF